MDSGVVSADSMQVVSHAVQTYQPGTTDKYTDGAKDDVQPTIARQERLELSWKYTGGSHDRRQSGEASDHTYSHNYTPTYGSQYV